MNEIHNRYVASVMAPTAGDGHVAYRGWQPCIDWCESHIGEGWWYISEGVFEFVDEADHLMFMLRWS
jgi:hypothetical protein